MLSIMESVKWVHQEAFDDQEWLSEVTISMNEKKKCWWIWITNSMSYAWCSGARCCCQRLRCEIEQLMAMA